MSNSSSSAVVEKKYVIPFILVTVLFALWGFANDVTNPLVAVFKDVFVINNSQSVWVQRAFYGGYATMAIPAALFIRKFSYKSGILVGLFLYMVGAFLSIPAASGANFNLFIVALYILTFGLAFLETTANPYILSMGSPETATRRLNLAQAFNPMGSLSGMFIAMSVILSTIQVEDFKNDVNGYYAEKQPAAEKKEELSILPFLKAKPRERAHDANSLAYVEQTLERRERLEAIAQDAQKKVDAIYDGEIRPVLVVNTSGAFAEELRGLDAKKLKIGEMALKDYKSGVIPSFQNTTHSELQKRDLKIVAMPYMVIGFVVLGVFLIFLIKKMPDTGRMATQDSVGVVFRRLMSNSHYVGGVVAQAFYVGAQIMCWTFIIQYAENELGIDKATAQNHNILAMVIFLLSRFICTFFLKYIDSGKLLSLLGVAAIFATLGAIYLEGMPGLYSLVAISACMSLMFPTIYGLALEGTGSDAKLGSAGLIFAILGGALMPGLQGQIMDLDGFMGTTATRGSFFLPVVCFVVIVAYGIFCAKNKREV